MVDTTYASDRNGISSLRRHAAEKRWGKTQDLRLLEYVALTMEKARVMNTGTHYRQKIKAVEV